MIIKSVLLDRKRYQLTSEDYDKEENLFTVIIGVNGTGKSRLLSRIVNDLNNAHKTKNLNSIPKNYSRHIEFINNGDEYFVYSMAKSKSAYFGNVDKVKLNPYLDTKIIAVTTSAFDKFPVEYKLRSVFKHHDNDLYHYIGLRISENSYNKSNYLHLFSRSLLRYGIKEQQEPIFQLLGYQCCVSLTFKPKLPIHRFQSESRFPISEAIFMGLLERHCPSIEFNIRNNKDLIREVYQSLIENAEIINRGILIESETIENPGLILLLDLGILQIKNIKLLSNEERSVNLSEASSGEQCILLTLLNISGVIKDNSVICIDEPEISLHPLWQKKFIELIKSCFKSFKKCHFIISTHSPLVISELNTRNSFILNMSERNAIPSSAHINKSVDYQLAELFESPGKNNEYLNRMVVSLLSKFSRAGKLSREDRVIARKLISVSVDLEEGDYVKDLIDVLSEALNRAKK